MLDQPRQSIVAARQNEVLGELARLRRDFVPGKDVARVDDGRIQPRLQAVRQEHRIEDGPRLLREPEADVGDAQHRERARQLLLHQPDAFDRLDRAVLVLVVAGSERERQDVEQELPGLEPVLQRPLVDPPRHFELALASQRHPLLVDGHRHRAGAVLLQKWEHPVDLLPPALEVDGIDDADARQPFQSGGDHLRLRRVDAERCFDLSGEDAHDTRHRVQLVGALGQRHADVERMCAAFHLFTGHGEDPGDVVCEQQLLHLPAALRVDALADDQRSWLLVERHRFQSAGQHRDAPRRLAGGAGAANGFQHLLQMCRRRSAASADDRQAEVAHEAGEILRELARLQRVDRHAFAVLRDAGIRLAGERERDVLGERPERIDHLARSGGAVQPHDVGAAGRDHRPRRQRLGAEQHAAGRIEGDLRNHRDAAPGLLHRPAGTEDLRAQLEQVLRGLRDDAVDTAAQQRDRLFAEDLGQFRGTDASEIGIAGGGQKSARPERSGDVAPPPVAALGAVGFRSRDSGRLLVHLRHAGAQLELFELGPAAAEGVRLDDVAPDLQVRAVHAGDDVGTRQRENLVAPLPAFEVLDRQVTGKLHPLQGRAHGAVENDDPAGDCIDEILVRHPRPYRLPRAAS